MTPPKDYPLPKFDWKNMFEWTLFIIFCLLFWTGFFLVAFRGCAKADEPKTYSDSQIADAIFKAENSKKYPYGIKSINTHGNKEYARKICLQSIRNAKKRWIKAGMPEDFIVFMGRRFSPPNINPNWVRLVRYFYNKG